MMASIIFLILAVLVLLILLAGGFHALRISIFGKSGMSHDKVAKIRIGTGLSLVLIIFGLFYNPLMDYWTLSETLNIHGTITNIQYAGTEFDGFLLLTDDKGQFMKDTSVVLDFQPYDSRGIQGKIQGTTDRNGLLILDELIPDRLDGRYNLKLDAYNRGRERSYTIQIDVRSSPIRIYSYTDRKLYKPGHTIHFASYIWEKSDAGFASYSEKEVNISLKNEKGIIIYKNEFETDDYGQVSLDFPLSVTAKEGTYILETQVGKMTDSYAIDVEIYQKPTINLDISTDSWAVIGEVIDVNFLATYLFGQPVGEAYIEITANSRSNPSYEVTDSGKLWNGEYKYRLDTGKLLCQKPSDHVIIKGEITDLSSGEVQTEEKTILLAANGLSIDIAAEKNRYDPGDLVKVKISAKKPDGTLAEDIDSKINVRKYKGGRSSIIFSQEKEFSDTYDYLFNYPTDAEYLRIEVTGNDGRYSASNTAYINLRPSEYWRCKDGCALEDVPDSYKKEIVLESDKTGYAVGESALISVYGRDNLKGKPVVLKISTPFSTSYKVFNLDSGATYSLDVAYELIAPMAAIQAYVYDNRFNPSDVLYLSASEEKELDISIDYLSSVYKPGDTVDLTIDTGKPSSQLTLGVVDESIMLLKNYEFTPFATMYALEEKSKENIIATSNPHIYRNGSLSYLLGILIAIIISGYTLSVVYMKDDTRASFSHKGSDRYLLIGLLGIITIPLTFLFATIIHSEKLAYLLFSLAGIAIIVSILQRIHAAYIKNRGSKTLVILGLAGTTIAIVPLMLAVLEIYSPGSEFLLYLFFGMILLMISYVGEYLKSKVKETSSYTNKSACDATYLRYLYLGAGGLSLFVLLFIGALLDITREESTIVLLFGISIFFIILSVIYRIYASYKKGEGNSTLVILGLVGTLMAVMPVMFEILEIYNVDNESIMYIILGIILLIISFLGEIVQAGRASTKTLVSVIFSLFIITALFGFILLAFITFTSSTIRTMDSTADLAGSGIAREGMSDSIKSLGSSRINSYAKKTESEASFKDTGKVPDNIRMRTNFPDTALWLPSIMTDSSGRARVPFILPDTITAWRIEALAATKDAEIGSAKESVISKMDYFIKASPPAEVTVGDIITVSIVVFNNRDEPEISTACITASTERCGVSSSQFKIMGNEPEKTILVPARSSKSAMWEVKFTGYGHANMSFLSYSNRNPKQISDGITKPVLIKPKDDIKTDVYSGKIETKSIGFEILDGAIPEFTSADLIIQPSLEAVSLDSIENLARYPHGCAEQVMSGLYPDILIKEYLMKSGHLTSAVEEKIDPMVLSGLQKIYNYHHDDGGWGWYERDQTNTFMTAYILYGLAEARNIGFYIDEIYFDGAERLLNTRQLPDGSFKGVSHLSKKDITMTAFVTYSLLNAGTDKDTQSVRRALSYLDGKYDNKEMNDAYTIALYALILEKVDRDTYFKTVLSKLDSMKKAADNNIYWGEDNIHRSYSLGGDVTTTSTVIQALSVSKDPVYYDTIQNGMDWMASKRGNYGWGQTSDTASALKAISMYSGLSGDAVDTTITVSLNGEHLSDYRINHDNRVEIRKISLDYIRGKNTLAFKKEGTGEIYYTLNVKQVKIYENITENTLSISKKYARTKVNTGQKLPVTVTLTNTGNEIYYIVAEDIIPPGFIIDEISLEDARTSNINLVEYEISGSTVSFYITSLGSETFTYNLIALNKGLVFAPPAKAYAMYDTENRDESITYSLEIE